MRSKRFLFILLMGLSLIGGLFISRSFGKAEGVLPSKSEANLETLSNDDGGVIVVVTPKLAPDFWSFEIVLDTHSVELDSDLKSVSFLADENGVEHQAVVWEGDPPGGHHRKGVLKFESLFPIPAAFTLKIKNVGSAPERSFAWRLP